ncbi:antitoxin Xre/MbcA/ParS toxin-binding domain-containing protein [Pseudomonas frederiksbergensis]|uniref:antitoxin Xre/MbcA/ParS toxin-binding domain-containing protein n=1 Tax=Pseudomonas frederiksbergensis TaxID=104087 RepID=UPI003D1A4386
MVAVLTSAFAQTHHSLSNPLRIVRSGVQGLIFEEALSLFENDVAAVTEWMSSPVRGLGSKCPIDMLGTRVEMKAVFDLIDRLERGVLV